MKIRLKLKPIHKVYIIAIVAIFIEGFLFQNCAAAPPPDTSKSTKGTSYVAPVVPGALPPGSTPAPAATPPLTYVPPTGGPNIVPLTPPATAPTATPNPNIAVVDAIYNAALGRSADATELNIQLARVAAGASLSYIREELVYSDEFEQKAISDTEAVKRMYNTLFGRAATATEVNIGVTHIASSRVQSWVYRPRTKLAVSIVGSAAYNALFSSVSRAPIPTYEGSPPSTTGGVGGVSGGGGGGCGSASFNKLTGISELCP